MKNIIKKTIILLITISIFSCNEQQKPNDGNEIEELQFNFSQVYNLALQENMSEVLELLDSVPNSKLNKEQKQLKDKYYKRFRYQNEKNKWITQCLGLFQSYWRKVLLNNKNIENEDKEIKAKLTDYLYEINYINSEISRDTVFEHLSDHLYEFIISKGFYTIPMGKTGNIYDFFLWAKQTEKIYEIKLPEKNVNVKVIFMEDFISNGWLDYSSFGESYAGGWAEKDALYCAKKAYVISSEEFHVSYLTHEAQHFADYISFPLLTSIDLEYRAKLAELGKAKETIYEILSKFIYQSKNDRKNAHPFACFCVIRDLSKEIFNQESVTDIEKWKKLSYQEINKAGIKLIKQNSTNLNNVGAERVTEFIE